MVYLAKHFIGSCLFLCAQRMYLDTLSDHYIMYMQSHYYMLCEFIALPNVLFPTESQQFTANELSDITFSCVATGFPAPFISFLIKGETLNQTNIIMNSEGSSINGRISDQIEILNTTTGRYDVSRMFTLFGVREEDTTDIVCIASASLPGLGVRSDNTSFSLNVNCKLPLTNEISAIVCSK